MEGQWYNKWKLRYIYIYTLDITNGVAIAALWMLGVGAW